MRMGRNDVQDWARSSTTTAKIQQKGSRFIITYTSTSTKLLKRRRLRGPVPSARITGRSLRPVLICCKRIAHRLYSIDIAGRSWIPSKWRKHGLPLLSAKLRQSILQRSTTKCINTNWNELPSVSTLHAFSSVFAKSFYQFFLLFSTRYEDGGHEYSQTT